MPRPVFDIEQYELRGHTPEVFTKKQKNSLTQTLSRANGQIDWAAQLLGFHGDKTWGRPVPKSDGSYNWEGLPATMNEKRQLQVGAFGVYNKNLPYESWPAPFNRSLIKASADAKISIFERDGEFVLAPYGQLNLVDYSQDTILYLGAQYEFNATLDVSIAGGGDYEDYADLTYFYVNDQRWTRLLIKGIPAEGFQIKVKGSSSSPLNVNVLDWTDPSDWTNTQVRQQFMGIWGNKGSTLSLDFSFDALDLHGFSEENGLGLANPSKTVTPEQLLSTIGLKPTIWTPFATDNFGFKFGSCPTAYPDAPLDPDTYLIRDETHTFFNCVTDCQHLVQMRQVRGTENEDCDFTLKDIVAADPSADPLASDPNVLDLEFDNGECPRSPLVVPGIESFEIEYRALNSCGQIGDPCLEWIIDPTLDNGEIDALYYLPENPWSLGSCRRRRVRHNT